MIHRVRFLLPFLVVLAVQAHANLDALPSAYHFKEHRFPVVDDSGHCGRAANASVKLGKVRFAQTHLMEPSWPFFYLAGGRPALIAVNLEGTGSAPDVRLTVKVKGVQVGSACLSGPAAIPPAAADNAPSLASLYTMTLPKEWVMPGMSVVVESGSDKKDFTAEQLQVKSPTEVNLLMAKMELMDLDDTAFARAFPEPKEFLADLAGALPVSVTRLGHFPETLRFDRMIFRDENGQPLLGCRADATDRTDCGDLSKVEGMDMKRSLLRFGEAISKALGLDYQLGYFYGVSSLRNSGGIGLMPGRVAQGSGYSNNFLHELGHNLSLAHWHSVYGVSPRDDGGYEYPYGGVEGDGGGRGTIWNWEPTSRVFVSPRCQPADSSVTGEERADVMSYTGRGCMEQRQKGQFGPWVGFSEFSAFSMHWFMNGRDTAIRGAILDRDTLRSYQVSSSTGIPTLVVGPGGRLTFQRGETQPVPDDYTLDLEKNPFAFLMPVKEESPLYLVYGSYHPRVSKANVIYKPIPFVGNGVDLIDPTDSTTFEKLRKTWTGFYGKLFSFGHDFTLRITYADGSTKTSILPHQSVSIEELRDTTRPWESALQAFALVVPAEKPLAKVELLLRPFISCDCDMDFPGNVAAPGSTITAANFLDSAEVLYERSFADVQPPSGVVAKSRQSLDLERLGGAVTLRGIDGRIVLDLVLEPGASLERRVREVWKRQGVWIVQLKTKSGSFSRTVVIQ